MRTTLAARSPLSPCLRLSCPAAAAADGSWLDQPLSNWNQAGMDIPQAPPMDPSTNPQCLPQKRPVDTSADQALVDSGWTLFSGDHAGWDTYVVSALSGDDGMCRPLGYNVFVFADGQFAGTISPDNMDSRTDGTGDCQLLRRQGLDRRRVPALHALRPAVLPVGPRQRVLQGESHADRPGARPRERLRAVERT